MGDTLNLAAIDYEKCCETDNKMKFQRQKIVSNGSSNVTCKNKSSRRGGSDVQFPGKLHDLMKHVESENLCHVISWACNGRAIMIHNPEKLVKLLPLFFGQTKFRSFQRQLNMWHFERLLRGPNKGAFVHPLFLKDQKDLCKHMSRHLCDNPWKENLTMDFLLNEMDAASVINAALNKTRGGDYETLDKNSMQVQHESTLSAAIPPRMAYSHQDNVFLQEETDIILSTIDEAEAVLSGISTVSSGDASKTCKASSNQSSHTTRCLATKQWEDAMSSRTNVISGQPSRNSFSLFGDNEATLLDEICNVESDDISLDGRQFFALDEPFREVLQEGQGKWNAMSPGSMLHRASEEASPYAYGGLHVDIVQPKPYLVDMIRSLS